MNLSMYSDCEKNLVMFLPDNITDEEIMSLGEMAFPYELLSYAASDYPVAISKPTCFLNLNNTHASISSSSIYPDNFAAL